MFKVSAGLASLTPSMKEFWRLFAATTNNFGIIPSAAAAEN
jgi:hypothetical protein